MAVTKKRAGKRVYARTRTKFKPKKKGVPNGLELRHKEELIDTRPDVVKVRYESHTFRLADNTTYTPDWEVQLKSGEIEYHEVKGGVWLGDSRVKFKMAAELYPEYHWKSFLYSGSKLKKEETL